MRGTKDTRGSFNGDAMLTHTARKGKIGNYLSGDTSATKEMRLAQLSLRSICMALTLGKITAHTACD
jgi:hypothetical protein